MRKTLVGALVALALMVPVAASADIIQRGYIVRIEAGEIYFDIGKASGVTVGAPIRFKRPVTLKHPVSGKDIVDELPLGELAVLSVGETLSMTGPLANLPEGVQVGDIVEVYVVREEPKPKPVVVAPKPKPTEPVKPQPEEPLPRIDDQTARVLDQWSRSTGRPVAEQIAGWEAFLSENPKSPFVAAINEDLTRLRAFKERLGAYEVETTATEPRVTGLEHNARTHAGYHERIALAFATVDGSAIRAAWLHFRKRGSETFRKAELRRDGDSYLRGEIAAEDVADPGIEYFVEVATAQGLVGSAIGSPDAPIQVPVDAPRSTEIFKETRRRSRISIRSTFLDYATFDTRSGNHQDSFLLVEADFLYRLYTRLYGVRVGFGSLVGRGGQTDPDPVIGSPRTGFNYGYWETEFRTAGMMAFLLRLVAGLGHDGLGFGIEGRARLGPETGTNLTFALSSLENIGFLSELHLQWAVFPLFPLGLGVALTNQPLGDDGDLGVRFSADIGVRTWKWFSPTVRVSYQGRTVNHSGVGGGVGLVFDW
jgi:hypothetical protein